MPELPEVEVIKKNLEKKLIGERIKDTGILKPYFLKTAKPNHSKIIGKTFTGFKRIGKYIIMKVDPLSIVYHGGLTGFLDIKEVTTRDTSFFIETERGLLLFRETGTKKTSGIYFTFEPENLPFIKKLGPDALSVDLTPDILKEKLRRRRDWIFNAIRDQSFIAGIGRAYANDILFEAKISPFTPGRKLTDKEIERLHYSIRIVLKRGIEIMEKRQAGEIAIKEKRDFLKVYRKKDQPCPVCGDTIQWVSFKDYAIYYCPNCQTGGKIYKDRRVSRFLK